MDDYKNIIPAGQMYLSGHYLEKESRSPKGGNPYRIYSKKIVYFYSELIIFPFVPFQETKKGKKNTLSNEDYCESYTLQRKLRWLQLFNSQLIVVVFLLVFSALYFHAYDAFQHTLNMIFSLSLKVPTYKCMIHN